MARMRSPSYPSSSISEAIDYVRKIHERNRTNPIDRGAAAKDMGYTGLSGRSAKVLADLAHFGLVEKAGKNTLKVTQLAVDILYPRSEDEGKAAIREAAFKPSLYGAIHDQFPDGPVSENALRSFLMREGFAAIAINPAINGYLDTIHYLQDRNVNGSRGGRTEKPTESKIVEAVGVAAGASSARGVSGQTGNKPGGVDLQIPAATAKITSHAPSGVGVLENERIVFMDESGPAQYVKLVASGPVDESLLDALSSYVERQKKRLIQARESLKETSGANAEVEATDAGTAE